MSWLVGMTRPFISEVEGLERYRELESKGFGPGYGPIESLVLHCVIRQMAPKRIVEVGSGLSTMITRNAAALNLNDGRGRCEVVCVEPYPNNLLKQVDDITLLASTVQAAPDELFTRLGAKDLLFIDSTHTSSFR
jgi:hypothetical protein